MLLELMLLSCFISGTAAATSSALPGCQDRCGNITIPYPFGIGSEYCYVPGFKLTCNDSYNPPKLYFTVGGTEEIEITQLLPDNLIIEGPIARQCHDDPEPFSLTSIELDPTGPYTISHTRNRFTAIGCDTGALISDSNVKYFSACITICRDARSVVNGTCGGIGCCQTAIPNGLKAFRNALGSLLNHNRTANFSPCSYGFLIDADAYSFNIADLYGFRKRTGVPVVLDWAVGNQTCAEAKDSGSLLCGAKSKCLESTNGQGYRCNCTDGYQGNPYLASGCQDIDECVDPTNSPCVDICTNTPGSYVCSCSHRGSQGDGRRDGSGCTTPRKTFPLIMVVLGFGLGFLLLTVASSMIYWGAKKRRLTQLKQRFFEQNGGLLLEQQISSHKGAAAETAKIFTAEELKAATDNYSQDRILGKGGYGTVYKGILPNETMVAVKKSKLDDGGQQAEQFINEVVVLSQVIHRNVVRILGCCLETRVPLLVYEYVPNNTLSHHLHLAPSSLSWATRLRIAAETGGALAYLHSETARPIIHRDVKSANILLDQNYTAKVSDFGASRFVALGKAHLTTLVQGTIGYLDPEYFQTGQLTDKSDVYSFGVVLVELLTGQTPVSSRRSKDERNLANYFIMSMERNQLFEILEARVAEEGDGAQLQELAGLAQRCLRLTGDERPTMKEVAEELERARRCQRQHPWDAEDIEEETGGLRREWWLAMISESTSGYFPRVI